MMPSSKNSNSHSNSSSTKASESVAERGLVDGGSVTGSDNGAGAVTVPAEVGTGEAGTGEAGGGTTEVSREIGGGKRKRGWRSAWLVLLLSVLFALVSDLWSKELAFAHVAGDRGPVVVDRVAVLEVKREDARAINVLVPIHEPVSVVPWLLEFKLVLNPGAVFGVGPGQRWFFVGFTGVALGFALWMFRAWTKPGDRVVHAALGLVIGGGIGNLYDRLVHACVRDFIHPLPGVEWPFGWRVMGSRELWPYVSNLADLYLLIGIGIVVVHLWRRDGA